MARTDEKQPGSAYASLTPDTESSRCPPFLIGALWRCMLHDSSRDGHPKDRLAAAACYQNYFSAMLCSDAVCQCKAQSGALLLPFAHKWLEHAVSQCSRNPRTVVLHLD